MNRLWNNWSSCDFGWIQCLCYYLEAVFRAWAPITDCCVITWGRDLERGGEGGNSINVYDAWHHHGVQYRSGWTVSYHLFSQLCFFVHAKYLNYDYKSHFHVIMTSSVLSQECLSSRICSTMLEWVAWQQLWYITLISHSLQITVHNVFVLSACDMMMAW